MSPEQEKHLGKDLKSVMRQSLRGLIESNSSLSGSLLQLIDDEQAPETSPEIAAALQFTEEFSRAARTLVEARGEVIFSKDQKAVQLIGEGEKEIVEEKRPTTFGQLLREKIDEALELGEEEFTKYQLLRFIGNRKGTNKAIAAEGLSKSKRYFSREETIHIIQRHLTISPNTFKRKAVYNRTQILNSFRLPAKKLDGWSEIVGIDWSKNTCVDFEETMQIRGLVQLENILACRQKS